jgi:hypothetical protein
MDTHCNIHGSINIIFDKFIFSIYDIGNKNSIEEIQNVQLLTNKIFGFYILLQIIIVGYLHSKLPQKLFLLLSQKLKQNYM